MTIEPTLNKTWIATYSHNGYRCIAESKTYWGAFAECLDMIRDHLTNGK